MKIICTDNFAREGIAETLVKENVSLEEGTAEVNRLNADPKRGYCDWYVLVVDEYRLSRGMEDLV